MAQNWQDRAVMMLAILAEQAKTMSYDDFATASDVPAPHRIHKLTDFLEELIARDIADKKPIRAAVVVSKVTNRPARGFFETVIAQGGDFKDLYHQPENEMVRQAVHSQMLQALNPDFRL